MKIIIELQRQHGDAPGCGLPNRSGAVRPIRRIEQAHGCQTSLRPLRGHLTPTDTCPAARALFPVAGANVEAVEMALASLSAHRPSIEGPD